MRSLQSKINLKPLMIVAFMIFLYSTSISQVETELTSFSSIFKMPESKAKVDSILNYTKNHREEPSMDILFKEAFRLVNKLKYNEIRPRLLDAYGVFKRDFSEYSDALKLHKESLEQAIAQKNEQVQIFALNNIGVVYRRLDENSEALNYHIKALRLAEQIGDAFSASVAMNSIGNIHIAIGNYGDAIKYFKKCLPIAEKAGNKLGIAMNLGNIGESFEKMNKLDSAEKYYHQSLDYNLKIDNRKGIAICYGSLGSIFKKEGKLNNATKLFEEALAINQKSGDKIYIAGSYNNLGDIYLMQNEYKKSGEMFANALNIATEIGSKSELKNSYEGLMKLNEATGNYKDAYTYSNLFKMYGDSINLENNNRHVRQMEAIYQTENEKNHIRLLETTRKNDHIIFIGSLILFTLLSLTAILYYLRNRLLERNKGLQRELEIRSQIASDLHDDMGSSLSSIHIFSELLRKDGSNSNELLNKIEENAKDTLEALDDIIWLVKPSNDKFSNLGIHLSEYAIPLFEGKNIDFEIDFPDSISEIPLSMECRRNIFLILKESINNLVKYSECTKAVVKAENREVDILFMVKDNGKGFDPAIITNRSGLKNLRARAKQINSEIKIISAPGAGTEITLFVKGKDFVALS